ncbi:uncharacterized protein ASCRUDRAFT_38207 [Ascoidea rubescens DSM 1968]|uniref:MFS general substrate transporter n=1 Tax=Ascoidea rubescens DSM 1968 TaxID=1344418 RepID=A0A1D2VBE4_9ASCO|nr:hypothetical protein ASCRUDRAFT_38207 [Ascoidea rubescens DSM 1968]ODV59014.1 hypothetical protein ASCRUDRAFT_38207 [Ascoidea rubescens DSM 1968]
MTVIPNNSLFANFKIEVKYLQLFCALLWCLFAAGPVFGFAALKPILIAQGVYENRCSVNILPHDNFAFSDFTAGDKNNNDNNGNNNDSSTTLCNEQDLALNFMFTLAAVLTNTISLIVGIILDKFGSRISGVIGSILISLGSLIFIYNSSTFFQNLYFFDPFLIGYSLLALGGPFVFISSYQLANLFPNNSGTVLAFLTGAFDSSSALFLVYSLVYFDKLKFLSYLNINFANLSLSSFFKCYLIVPFFIIICQLFIMPKEKKKTDYISNNISNINALVDSDSNNLRNQIHIHNHDDYAIHDDEHTISSFCNNLHPDLNFSQTNLPKKEKEKDILIGICYNYSLKRQLSSKFFILMCLFTSIQMLRINYFIATIKTQETYLLDSIEKAIQVNKIFDLALPIGGLLSIPFIGLILDNFQCLNIIKILLVISIVIGLLGMTTSMVLNIFGVWLLVIYRPFYYTTVSDYCLKIFGNDNFGMVYGSIIFISGLFNLNQYFLDNLTHNFFQMNPIPVNLMLVVITFVLGWWLLQFVIVNLYKIKKRDLVEEAEQAPTFEIPY